MPPVTPVDGPVAVTGASGYIGAHTVLTLVKHGYNVRACVRDPSDKSKTEHLLAMNSAAYSGKVELCSGDVFKPGSYDEAFEGCSAIFHVGTAVGFNKETPRQVYDGTLKGTVDVLDSVKKAGTVKRFINVSSMAAVGHPVREGYEFTEKDFADDKVDGLQNHYDDQYIDKNRDIAYMIAKTEAERQLYRIASEDGRFDAISIMPSHVIGPVLCKAHNQPGSWQACIGKMLAGKPLTVMGRMLWNISDVRDNAEAMRLIAESSKVKNGSRFCLAAVDESGILTVSQLQQKLAELFPGVDVAGEVKPSKHGYTKTFCNLACRDLGLKPHTVQESLLETGRTLIDLGITKPARRAVSKL